MTYKTYDILKYISFIHDLLSCIHRACGEHGEAAALQFHGAPVLQGLRVGGELCRVPNKAPRSLKVALQGLSPLGSFRSLALRQGGFAVALGILR